MRIRPSGYCPRCNAKARHRRIWLFLREHTDVFTERLDLFHVSPKYSLSRRFKRMRNLRYVAGDISDRANLSLKMDVTAVPFRSNAFDAIICIHVLEHVQDDRKAMSELCRVLRPGGWAVISVPVRLDRKTYEDPAITSPAERERAFGETSHFRYYGYDLTDRLEEAGFEVELDPASNLDEHSMRSYGLLDDENVFYCRKPRETALAGEVRHESGTPVEASGTADAVSSQPDPRVPLVGAVVRSRQADEPLET